jgi:nitrate reductase (cytochrome), electron transfer subunit
MTAERSPIVPLRAWLIGAVVATSFIGFFFGVRTRPPPAAFDQVDASRPSSAPPARSHEELAANPWRPNRATWIPHALPDRVPVTTRDPQALAATLLRRAERRAFDGAPPTIPHPVSQASGVECRACHEHGAMVAGRIAPAMSHPVMPMCTQCHVPETTALGVQSTSAAATVGSDFMGYRLQTGSTRYGPDAPPQPNHPRFMRENCLACHGAGGSPGLQTSHPDRLVCEQCHPTDALLDQHPGAFE